MYMCADMATFVQQQTVVRDTLAECLRKQSLNIFFKYKLSTLVLPVGVNWLTALFDKIILCRKLNLFLIGTQRIMFLWLDI